MPQAQELRILLADNQAGTSNAISIAARNCDLAGQLTYGEGSGKRGTRQQYACGDRILREDVSGGFEIYPTAAELDWLIERFMGDNISGYPAGAATPKETLPKIYAYVDKGDELFRYDELVVASLGIQIRESDYINFRVDFIGKDETSGVTWPATPPDIDCDSEFIASDVSFNIAAAAWPFKQIDMLISNSIPQNQHENSVKRTIFEAGPLVANMQVLLGYRTSTKALYRRGIAGDNNATLVLSDGSDTYTLTFGNLKAPDGAPTVPDEGEITNTLNFSIKRTPTVQQISIAKT